MEAPKNVCRIGDPACTSDGQQTEAVKERVDLAIRTILSNIKPCVINPNDPALADLLGRKPDLAAVEKLIGVIGRVVTPGMLACGIAPGMLAFDTEAQVLRRDNAALRKEIEIKRFALETVVGNNGNLAASMGALKSALPGHPHLN